jgi:hypothetical protein
VLFSTLNVLRDKGLISQAEYDSAVKDMLDSLGLKAGDQWTLMIGKFGTTFYGFAEGDYIYDSTQSLIDIPGAPLIARGGTFAGDHSRTQFSPRNSRLGFRFKAPEFNGIRASARFEGDFNVQTVPIGYNGAPYQQSETSFFTNPVFRMRHYYGKIENPVVDVLFGQTWHLFGWQDTYQPNTVQPQGIPGELYSRTMQLRLSKTFKNEDFQFDIAVAASRPPQRDSSVPEGEGGIHFAYNKWKTVQTLSSTGTTISPLSVAVTGDLRHFEVNNFALKPNSSNGLTTNAIAADAFIPILPATAEDKANALSLLGEFASGYGFTDMYTSLASGVTFPCSTSTTAPCPQLTGMPAAGAFPYTPNVDQGFVTYDNAGHLHGIQWTTARGGLQYYFPNDGKIWVAANYSYVHSANAHYYGAAAATLDRIDWWNAVLMGDLTPAIRMGVEFDEYRTLYNDEAHATNVRVFGSLFYLF